MASIITALTAIKEDLAKIEGIKSVQIGIEPAINPAMYPAIRLVPLEEIPDNHAKRFTLDIYVGYAVKPETIEESYSKLYVWADSVIDTLSERDDGIYVAFWRKTTNDEDRLPAAKMVCVSFEVVY